MTLLEELVAEINRSIYYREFSFTRNDFTPAPGEDKEFADHVIWIDDLLMVFQIKERSQPDDNEPAAAKWFRKKVVDLGSRQVRETLGFLQEYDSISIENQRGHRFDVANATVNHCVKVIVYFGGTCLPEECAATRHHQSQTAGLIHVISSLFDHRLQWLESLTRASKYECRTPKHIGAAVARCGNDHLVEWCYLEGEWRPNRAIDELLHNAYPFRPLKAGGGYRYEFS